MALAPLEITVSKATLDDLRDRLGQLQDRLPQLIAWAANRATQAMKREILVASADEGIPRKLARYRTRRPRAAVGKPEAHILAGRIGWKWGRLLSGTQARKAPGGLQIRLGRKTQFIAGGFVTRVGAGRHQGVFVRAGQERLPIQEVRTESLTDIAEESGRVPAIVAEGQEVFLRRLNAEVDLLLAGISRPPEPDTEVAT
ncbi:MAG TPA: hypothetical protein PLG73_10790 [Candidatus Sumerlaeota bacterium]|nr:hypothetical protein [Candidatus Sumerlaeota bacterium]